jgi:hypothetical protein
MWISRWCLLLFTIVVTDAWGHGRVNSSIAADVREDRVAVTLHASLVDLMIVGGLAFAELAEVPPEEQPALLLPHLRTMGERFRLMLEDGSRLEPVSVRHEAPSWETADFRFTGIDQQQMRLVLDYPLASPPASLLFWQSFGEGRGEESFPTGRYHVPADHRHETVSPSALAPIYAALSIRQKGEMVLLPSELGPGFPVLFPFSWEEEVVPLAHRSSLSRATSHWENRPANARLQVEGENVTFRVYLSLEAIAAAFPEKISGHAEGKNEGDWHHLHDTISRHIRLAIDGTEVATDRRRVTVHPPSAMAVLHDRRLPPGRVEPGIVVVEIAVEASRPPHQIEAGWALFAHSIPRLYTEMVHAGEPAGFFVLSASKPSLSWRNER